MRYVGLLYRALNPRYARDAHSGAGASRHGGRFNPRGMPALYTSLSVMTAVREANQIGTLQPTTLVAYQADLNPIFDATDATLLGVHGMDAAVLGADDWRQKMQENGMAPTQALAERVKRAGYVGLKTRSFAKGASEYDLNLVVWVWGTDRPTCLRLVDDQEHISTGSRNRRPGTLLGAGLFGVGLVRRKQRT